MNVPNLMKIIIFVVFVAALWGWGTSAIGFTGDAAQGISALVGAALIWIGITIWPLYP